MDRQSEISPDSTREYHLVLDFPSGTGLDEGLSAITVRGEELMAFLTRTESDDRALFVLNLAFEELSTNVVRHVTPFSERMVRVECRIAVVDGVVDFQFSDDGPAFRPFEATVPQKEKCGIDQGGKGLELLRQFFPDMRYRRRNGRNEIRLTFPCREG